MHLRAYPDTHFRAKLKVNFRTEMEMGKWKFLARIGLDWGRFYPNARSRHIGN